MRRKIKTHEDKDLYWGLVHYHYEDDKTQHQFCMNKTDWALYEQKFTLHEKYGIPEKELDDLLFLHGSVKDREFNEDNAGESL